MTDTPARTLLFAEGRNAVQVQQWLDHHSAAFILATYVHLLDGDLGGRVRCIAPATGNREDHGGSSIVA